MRRLVDRARTWLDRTPLPPVLHPAVGIALGAYTDLYRLRLKVAADAPAALVHRRPALPRSARLRLLLPARARAAPAWGLFPFPVRPCPLPEPAPADPPEGLGWAEQVRSLAAQRRPVVPPTPHPSGARPPQLPAEAMPHHVAIVMDGNGRWATARGLPRTDGHRAGADALTDAVHGALEIGLKYLTVYAFSTENRKRPADELQALMYEIPQCLRRLADDAEPLDVRVRWAGARSRLPADVVQTLVEAERATRDRTGLTVTMCANLRRPGRDHSSRSETRSGGGRREARPRLGLRARLRPLPARPRTARRRPAAAHRRRPADLQLPPLAGHLRRTAVPRTPPGPRWTAATCGTRSNSTPTAPAATAPFPASPPSPPP
ncbi:hypothetical protein Scel_23010 [Streptomyces cellostaticus]|nr:hypothetical protein Scel_23010 [Streptomyces cellostaticus]